MKKLYYAAIVLSGILNFSCSKIENETQNTLELYDVVKMYDENQSQPPIVMPFSVELIKQNSKPPSDAIVLFNGSSMDHWVDQKGNKPGWLIENGYMEVVKGTGGIKTKQNFGSVQLHIEWAAPSEVKGNSQERGNSGVYLMNTYEIQILDSFNNITYPAGMAASVYGQNPPSVNASRVPGEWQSYDIVFRRPVFERNNIVKPAYVTVFHNGILVQDHFEIIGATVFKKKPEYRPHADKLPLSLQNHGNPVRFRNIWIREIADK